MAVALVFPGQGSQAVGMDAELAKAYAAARNVFDEVDAALGQKLSQVMFEGPIETLTLTEHAPPALLAVSMAVMRVLEERGFRLAGGPHGVRFVAGHSLGEYSALCAAGALSIADGARLLRIRGRAMQAAVPVGKGAMAALLGAVFAGAAQFVALDLWREPVPWLLVTATVLVVNLRHVMMGASLSRHMGAIPAGWRAPLLFLLVDESWAFSERRVLSEPLTASYYVGLGLPLLAAWTAASAAGAVAGQHLGDPAAYGFDFAFSALFIGIIAGFWRGTRTGAVLAASALAAITAKLTLAGAWYIVLGGAAGVAVAAALHGEHEQAGAVT